MNTSPSSQRAFGTSPTSPLRSSENQRRAAFNTSIGVAIVVTAMMVNGARNIWPIWTAPLQNQLTFVLFLVMDILAVQSIIANRKTQNINAYLVMLFGIMVGGSVANMLISGPGMVLAGMIFILAIMSAAYALPSQMTNRVFLIGTAAAGLAFVLDLAVTWQRSPVPQQTVSALYWILGIVAIFVVATLIRVYNHFPMLTKVVLPFMLASVVSVVVLSAYNSAATRYALTESANQKLRAAALQTAAQIDAFFASVSNSMLVERSLTGLVDFLQLPADAREGSEQERAANALLRSLQARGFIRSYSLLDTQGNVLLSTSVPTIERARGLPRLLEIDLAQPDFLNLIMLQNVVRASPVMYDSTNQPILYFAVQVIGSNGLPVGILVSEYSLVRIQTEIAVQNNGLAGGGSFTSIITEDGVRIANGQAPSTLNRLVAVKPVEEIQSLISRRRLPSLPTEQLVGEYPDYGDALAQAIESRLTAGTALEALGEEETAAYFYAAQEAGSTDTNRAAMVRTVNFPWYISYLQPQSILLAPVDEQIRLTTLLGIGVAVITIFASILIAQTLTRPIQRLTETASQVAEGDLTARARVTSQDELGTLANVFNDMTEELGQTLQGLEQRVDERTKELVVKSGEAEQRASQLQAIADISRAIASERELDNLLPLITHTISERFDFYHVGIFMIDDQGEFAVLRAANSEGGLRMLARSHRLRVGQEGIIGYVTSRGEPRVALDVGRDAVFFNNPDLPTTRSEIGLPLRAGEKIIGALDVQSTKPGAFGDADVALLSILADQVSTAIENARLFSETNQALTELESIQRQYLRQQWQRKATEARQAAYVYDFGQLRRETTEQESIKAAGIKDVLSAAISLRGEEIGAIELLDPTNQRSWTEEERSLAQAVAQQVGLALENARLIEETQRRAERESLVTQITSRLRASNDPQTILQTAVQELRDALQSSKAQILTPVRKGPAQTAEEE